MKTADYNNITKARDYRLFARNHLYKGEMDVTDLIDCLDSYIGVKSAKYDSNTFTLYLTISHDINKTQITSYYDMINMAFLDHLNDGYVISLVERNAYSRRENLHIPEILQELQVGTLPINTIYNASLINESEYEDMLVITL